MKDPTLERIWLARDSISKSCGYDPVRLVDFYRRLHSERLSSKRAVLKKLAKSPGKTKI